MMLGSVSCISGRRTREDQPFLNLSGIQPRSVLYHCQIEELHGLEALEVEVARLIPQARGMGKVVALFDRPRRDDLDAAEARRRLERLAPIGCATASIRAGAGMEMLNVKCEA